MNNFSSLGVSAPVLKSLERLGFETPTTIQQKAIPVLNKGNNDFIGLAQTGTGKTAAFGLPLLDLVDPDDYSIQALILAPTRELSQQIARQLIDFSKYVSGLGIQMVYGGMPIQRQVKALRNTPQILVATPGRLIDLMGRRALKLDRVKYVVLDEADEMLNMGFKESIDKILSKTPAEKHTWLFSATMSTDIRAIVKHYMHRPEEVRIDVRQKVNANISHHYIVTDSNKKQDSIKRLLDAHPEMSAVIFCRTRRETKVLARDLAQSGYSIESIHGDLTQHQRDKVMRKFRQGTINLLTATDVVARGIDVQDLSHVIHYSLPDDLEYYTHRSGRTARAGKKGVSVALATRGEIKKIRVLEKKLNIRMGEMKEAGRQTAKTAKLHGQQLSEVNRTPLDKVKATKPVQKFFINVGKIDNLSKKQLLSFVSSQTGIARNQLYNLKMFQKHSYFEAGKRFTNKIQKDFSGASLDGRSLRVNRAL